MTKFKPYRLGAIAIVINENDQILLVQLNSYKDDEWNLPGGGRKSNETPEENAQREVTEELGIKTNQLKIIGVSKKPLKYDFPKEMVTNEEAIAMEFRGQQKDQIVFRYKGSEDLEIDRSELKAYMWCKKSNLKDHLLFPGQFEKTVKVLEEFNL